MAQPLFPNPNNGATSVPESSFCRGPEKQPGSPIGLKKGGKNLPAFKTDLMYFWCASNVCSSLSLYHPFILTPDTDTYKGTLRQVCIRVSRLERQSVILANVVNFCPSNLLSGSTLPLHIPFPVWISIHVLNTRMGGGGGIWADWPHQDKVRLHVVFFLWVLFHLRYVIFI